MGLFDKIFGKRPAPVGKYQGDFKMLTGYAPRFTSFGGEVYESELVRAAINARATHISKLKVDISGSARPKLQAKMRRAPNEFQTWSQFLYRLSTILDVHNTAFIVPVFDDYGEVSGVYAILPERCEFVQYGGVPYVRYSFSWGEKAAIELSRVGILTKFQYRSDLLGESNRALLPTMELIHMQDQGITEGVRSSATYRFMAQTDNFVAPDDLVNERLRFSSKNLSRDADAGGLLLFPYNYKNIKQIDAKPWVVDAEQMRVINQSVYSYFGVNEDVLTNKAFGDAWAAFYEGVVESFAIQFSEVMTKMLFTIREQAQGSFVIATANRLQYMSNKDKLEVAAAMADRGLMTRNEIREIFNLSPLPGGIGDSLPVRGEYYDLGGESNDNEDDSAET